MSSTTLFRTRNSEYDLDNDGVSPQELARAVSAGQVSPFVPIDPNAASFVVDQTDSFTQDLHLSGDAAGGAVTWLVGGEALILDSDFTVATARTPTVPNPLTGDIVRSRLQFNSYAAYGSLGLDVTDRPNLTGELRWTRYAAFLKAQSNATRKNPAILNRFAHRPRSHFHFTIRVLRIRLRLPKSTQRRLA